MTSGGAVLEARRRGNSRSRSPPRDSSATRTARDSWDGDAGLDRRGNGGGAGDGNAARRHDNGAAAAEQHGDGPADKLQRRASQHADAGRDEPSTSGSRAHGSRHRDRSRSREPEHHHHHHRSSNDGGHAAHTSEAAERSRPGSTSGRTAEGGEALKDLPSRGTHKRARSRSRSRSRSPDRNRDRGRHDGNGRPALRSHPLSPGALDASPDSRTDGPDAKLRRRSGDGGSDAMRAEAAAGHAARQHSGPGLGAGLQERDALHGQHHPSAAAAAGAGAGARHAPASKPLVSFAEELDELAGGGATAAGGSRRTSGNGSGGAAATGSGSSLMGLAASTAHRFLREEASQRLSIPPRTITTTSTPSSVPLAPLLPTHTTAGAGVSGGSSNSSNPLARTSLGNGTDSFRLGGGTTGVLTAGTVGGTAVEGRHGHGHANGHAGGGVAAAAVQASGGVMVRGGSPPGTSRRTLGRIVYGMASARCARPYMEDRHCIVQCLRPIGSGGQPLQDGVQRSLAAIYDGHNGTRAADTAASRLHMLLAADPALRTSTGELGPPAVMESEEGAISQALRRSFRHVDDEILAGARQEGARDGATALLVLRLSDTLYAAHAGDSRAVLSRGGFAVRLTEDHKPHLPAERARVEAAGGRVDFQRCWRVIVEPREGRLGSGLAVSRSLGDLDFKEPKRFVECEPDVRRLVPVPGDNFVVLASDGLWDVLSDQEAVDCANAVLKARCGAPHGTATAGGGVAFREEDARAAAAGLLELAVRRGTADNVTVIVMLLQWD